MKPNILIPSLRNRLLRWFRSNARDLPWRKTHDPYAVWISEIMLQQTQVATVIPYYLRFLERFPDVQTLANAKIDSVLKCWQGLGYYTRARKIHEAAKIISRNHAGRLPSTVEDLMQLPGIGRYTAGAVASIAFGKTEPVLDGNVTRVLCRIFNIADPPKKPQVQNTLWQLAHQIIERGKAGQLNQALMELGALICKPKNPDCTACPVNFLCQANKRGIQEQLPLRQPAKTIPHYHIAAAVIYKNGRILIDRRKPKGLLGGLWEFPGGKQKKGELLEHTAVRETREELGIDIKVIKPIITVKHAYSHFRITLHAFQCQFVSGKATPIRCDACKWIWPKQLNNYPFPLANQKIIAALLKDVS